VVEVTGEADGFVRPWRHRVASCNVQTGLEDGDPAPVPGRVRRESVAVGGRWTLRDQRGGVIGLALTLFALA